MNVQVCLAIVTAFSFFLPPAVGQKKELEWPTRLNLIHAVRDIPDELRKELPFSLESYFDLKREDNRKQPYLEVAVEYFTNNSNGFPDIVASDDYLNDRKVKKRVKLFMKYQDQLRKTFRGLTKPNKTDNLSESQLAKVQKLSARFDPAFEKLRIAQAKKSDCFIHQALHTKDGSHFELANVSRQLVQLLRIRALVDPDSIELIEDLRAVLLFITDVSKFSSQDFFLKIEQDCFAHVVKPILDSSSLPEEHLDKLIENLKEHRAIRIDLDPVLEQAKYNLWVDVARLQILKDRGYRENPQFPGRGYSETREIMHLIRAPDNRLGIEPEALLDRWKKSARPAQEAQMLMGIVERNQPSHVVLGSVTAGDEFVARLVLQMKPQDFDRDIGVLKARYKYIEKACGLPFPQSTEKLLEVVSQWCPGNDDWRSSPILLWSLIDKLPNRKFPILDVNAYLTIAALRKWQFKNDGAVPENLDGPMKGIGFSQPLQDPFSGEPLKWKLSGPSGIVYSVGPNGRDDNKQISNRYSRLRNEFPSVPGKTTKTAKAPVGNIKYVFRVTWN